MVSKGSSPSTVAEDNVSAPSSLLPPPGRSGRRRSPRSDVEKLNMVCNFMRNEFRWGVSDFVKTLAFSDGSNNTRRKAAFAAAAYKDPEVLKSYFGDVDQQWDGGRQSIIEILDLGNNELRREVERLGDLALFNKYDPASKSGGFDALGMDKILHTIQEEAPLLLQLIRDIMAPKAQQYYTAQKEPVSRIVAIMSILCFSQRKNSHTGFQTTLGIYLHSKGVKREQIELLSRLGFITSYGTIIKVIKEQPDRSAAQVKCMG
ncbi:hypothetical protein P152DRAFT_88388 [Eremomyces bilateralis CBS 781.70]|uniref:Uncharacterized protein n=1 Tax=Eremomyces bilateralis CBS 781.70 TaxID=1392243 RepID=A0A6G1FXP7_9PEZI|nr:uncharacterized protein P152DRAFT_88388 [Eremomyces bilateralis CBS 781.70]KAF1810528.1 hypothetical protein P152DRAFT_88388 [Eremomyces bilateralis CBS 781.70]